MWEPRHTCFESIGAAPVELQHGDGTRRGSGEDNLGGVNVQVRSMSTNPCHRGSAVLDSDIDAILESSLQTAEAAEGGHLGGILQSQAIVDANHRESTLCEQLRYRLLVFIVAFASDESTSKESHHTSLVGSRLRRAVDVEIERGVALHKRIGLLAQ